MILPGIVLSQIEGEPYSSILKVNDKRFKGNKGDLALKNTGYFIYKTDTVPVMRVPYYLVKSQAKEEILGVQNELSSAKTDFSNQKKLLLDRANSLLATIKFKDKSWLTDFYDKELEFYQRFEKTIKPRETFVADSISKAKRKAEKEKRASDSLIFVEKTKGYYFVNAPRLSLQEQAGLSSKIIGTIEAYSYVKKVQENEVSGYTKIKVDEAEGYVLSTFLVSSLDKVTVSSPNRETAYKGYFASFIKVQPAATNSLKQSTEPKFNPSSNKSNTYSTPSRTYYTGPKGGCYYYNSAGKKVYVDHSFCN